MQFALGMLECFIKDIPQGSFQIKKGRVGASYIYGDYRMINYNLVHSLFANSEEQIWILTVEERLYKVSGFIETCGNFPNPRVKLHLNGRLERIENELS